MQFIMVCVTHVFMTHEWRLENNLIRVGHHLHLSGPWNRIELRRPGLKNLHGKHTLLAISLDCL